MNDEGSEGMSGGCTRHSLITAALHLIPSSPHRAPFPSLTEGPVMREMR